MKKLPAAFVFLALWLAIVINIAKPLSYSNSPPSAFAFRNYTPGIWVSRSYVNWIPGATLAIANEYNVYSDCKRLCNASQTCTAFRLESTTSYGYSNMNCYLYNDGPVPALSHPDLVEPCTNLCASFIKSTTDPKIDYLGYDPGYTSPFTPGNQGCSQPMYYGLILCIALTTVVCLVYWTFFTLTVPAGRFFRLIFFVTMVGAIVCGSYIARWVDTASCCPQNYRDYGAYDYLDPSSCTAEQFALKNAAIGACICLILLGVWPVVFFPWFFVSTIVFGGLVGLWAMIMQDDFVKIWSYLTLCKWLFWQEEEQKQALLSGHVDSDHAADNAEIFLPKAAAPVAGANEGEVKQMLLACQMENQRLQTENQALIRRLNESGVHPHALQEAISAEQAASASLRQENARLRKEALLESAVNPSAPAVPGGPAFASNAYGGVAQHGLYPPPAAAYADNVSLFNPNPPAYADDYGVSASGSSDASSSSAFSGHHHQSSN